MDHGGVTGKPASRMTETDPALADLIARSVTELHSVVSELRAREQRYKALLEALPDLMFRVNRDGVYLQAWPEDRPDLVVKAKEIVGRSVYDVLPPDLAERLHKMINRVCDEQEMGIAEYPLAINGEWMYFEARTVACSSDEVLTLIRNITDRKRDEAELLRLQEALRERLSELEASRTRIVEAADAERRRVERDIHDGAQQRLLASRLSLELAARRLRSGDVDGAEVAIAEADGQLENAVSELRSLAHGIYPGVLTDEGVGPAIEMLVRRSPVPVRMRKLAEGRFRQSVETAVYFIACEALNNVVKHAQASVMEISLEVLDGRVVLEMADDGIGGLDEARGSGLRGIRDRVEALSGEVYVESPAGSGTTLRAVIPCG